MEKNMGVTPRQHCASRRSPAFKGIQPLKPHAPTWQKITGGLMAVTDGSPKNYVAPGLVFGVELDADGKPVIASYWDESSPTEGVGAMRPRTLGTCKVLTQEGRMTARKLVTFDEMCKMVRAVLPMAWLPEEADFFRLYGIEVD